MVPVESSVPRHDIPTPGRSGFVLVQDRQVHYLEWGRAGAAPVVCLHGGGQSVYMWEGLGAALGPTHHVLAPDLPMHGDSDPVGEMSRQALAATIPALLAEFGFERGPTIPALKSRPIGRYLSAQISGYGSFYARRNRVMATRAWAGGS